MRSRMRVGDGHLLHYIQIENVVEKKENSKAVLRNQKTEREADF